MLAAIGLMLLVLPGLVARLWPWDLPRCWRSFIARSFWEWPPVPRWEGARSYAIANLFLFALVVVVSLLHIDRFRAGPATWIWFGFCLVVMAGFA